MTALLDSVDHLVCGSKDLEATVAFLERLLGVRASPGGRHEGRGTRNALIALGPRSYLEIVGPDHDQPVPFAPRWFGIDDLAGPGLVTWAAGSNDLDRVVAEGTRHGVVLGPITSGSRLREDGTTLRWRFTDPNTVVEDGLVPFFIDWGASAHPAASAAPGAELIGLRAEHPDSRRVRDRLLGLGVELEVTNRQRPALVATIRTRAGTVELR